MKSTQLWRHLTAPPPPPEPCPPPRAARWRRPLPQEPPEPEGTQRLRGTGGLRRAREGSLAPVPPPRLTCVGRMSARSRSPKPSRAASAVPMPVTAVLLPSPHRFLPPLVAASDPAAPLSRARRFYGRRDALPPPSPSSTHLRPALSTSRPGMAGHGLPAPPADRRCLPHGLLRAAPGFVVEGVRHGVAKYSEINSYVCENINFLLKYHRMIGGQVKKAVFPDGSSRAEEARSVLWLCCKSSLCSPKILCLAK